MADLGLRENLQPALLDRLLDTQRFITLIQVCVRRTELDRLRLQPSDLVDTITGKGLKPVSVPQVAGSPLEADELELWFSSPGRSVGLQRLKESMVRPPGGTQPIAVQSFCRVHARAVLNSQLEGMDRGAISMRNLRESVFRDLRWLLNSSSLDTTEDLSRYPLVARSVVNYGMPTVAGKSVTSIDAKEAAARIALAIRCFEPRLSKVQVIPEKRKSGDQEFALEFRIEAELWGQPAPQHLLMRTRIDLDTGQASLVEGSNR
jgi:type VI secretion system protein ImpF